MEDNNALNLLSSSTPLYLVIPKSQGKDRGKKKYLTKRGLITQWFEQPCFIVISEVKHSLDLF